MMTPPRLILVFTTLYLALIQSQPVRAIEESDIEARRQRVISELQSRRAKREIMGYAEAKSYSPRGDFQLPPDNLPGFPVGLAAQMIANSRQKEVLVSAAVASLMLDIERSGANEEAILGALRRSGVQLTEVGTSILVFSAASR